MCYIINKKSQKYWDFKKVIALKNTYLFFNTVTPKITAINQNAIKIKKITLAIEAAPAAIPVNPKIAATTAIIVMLYKNQLFTEFFVEYNTRFYQYIIFSFVQYCAKPSMERRLKSYIVLQKLVNKIFKKTKSQLAKH